MGDSSGSGVALAALMLVGIWSLVGLLIYVWYLWALARLFPSLGLPAAHGWIPVFNQWRLIERGGFPGWLVLLMFLPAVNIVVVVVTIIAIHRINQENNQGASMTVLGALIPPLWATLLGSRLRASGSTRGGSARPDTHPEPRYPVTPGYPGNAVLQGSPAAPAAPANTGLVEYGPGGQVFPLLNGHAQAPMPGMAPGMQQASAPSPSVPNPSAPQGAGYGMPPVPPLPPIPAVHADLAAQATPPAHAASGASSVHPVVPQASPLWAPDPASLSPSAAAPPASAPSGDSKWSLGNTIDNNFERLANEALPQRDATFGAGAAARPFSWPEPQATPPVGPPAAPAPAAAPASAEALQPLVLPAAPVVPAASVVPVAPPAPPAPTFAPPTPVVSNYAPAVPATPTPTAAPAQELAPEPAVAAPAEQADPHPAAPPRPATSHPATSDPADVPSEAGFEPEEGFTATVITGGLAPQPIAVDAGEELDRTIMVPRRTRWALELPDGALLELDGEDIVLGRRPAAVDGSSVLLVPDTTRTLSKSHARLRRVGEVWTIEDLNSTNGVFVFDEKGAQVELAPGMPKQASEQLIIGTLEVRLRTIL